MTLEMLVQHFIRVKQEKPSNVDELLDFTMRSYILGELTIAEYHRLFGELNAQGATKPDFFPGNGYSEVKTKEAIPQQLDEG